jgi:uncharacterized protein
MKVIVDSNALFVPLQFRIDIFSELERLLQRNFELILLSPVKKEMELFGLNRSLKLRKTARYALQLAEKCKYVAIEAASPSLVDDIIVRIAHEWGAPVFTNDRQLRKRLRDISVPVIYVRQKSHLAIDGMV